MTNPTTSARPNARDRLHSLYGSPAPFTSLYFPCGPLAETKPLAVFDQRRDELAARGVSQPALSALQARLALPVPDDVGGWALHVADDGSTAVDFAPEGPAKPIFHVGLLPMVAPLVEWDQWRVPHITVSFGQGTAEVTSFLPGVEPAITPLPADPIDATDALRLMAAEEQLRLIVVIDEGGLSNELADRLKGVVPPQTNVVVLEEDASVSVEATADATVRYVADVVARDTVQALENLRFLRSAHHAVQGSAEVFDALARGAVQTLLVHDDPNDPATASFGPTPALVSNDPTQFDSIARRADVAIWSATLQGAAVRIIPSTSALEDDDNIAAILIDQTVVAANQTKDDPQ